jgi:fatty-acyl-CoA synthase
MPTRMSRFIDSLLATAGRSEHGIVTGEREHPRRRTWAQVHDQARAVAAALIADGLEPGGAVALLAVDPALIAPAAQGVWLAGGSVTMLHPPTARGSLAEWVADCVRALKMIGAGTVLLDPSFELVVPLLDEHGVAHRPLAALAEASMPDDERPVVPRGEQDTALLQLTSGSTGSPKAVRITHGNLVANIGSIAERTRLDPDRDVMMSWLPLFHDMGMVGFLATPMALGLELVQITPVDFLNDPLIWPALLDKYRATVTCGPNFAFALLGRRLARVKDPDAYDLSPLRVAVNGAEPIDDSAVRAFTDEAARFGLRAECVLPAYGMAEATLAVSMAEPLTGLSADAVDPAHPDAATLAAPAAPGTPAKHHARLGRPLSGLEVAVVAADGSVLGERRIGEILVRGESVTEQYITPDGLVAARDERGWLHTGDLGYLVDGEVVICGRSKDAIIMAGRNIYPTDIERAAESVQDVRAGGVAAVRLDAGTAREGFALVLESRQAGDADAEQRLVREVTSRVVDVVGARPAAVRVVKPGTLPKTPSGKLRRADAARLLALTAA